MSHTRTQGRSPAAGSRRRRGLRWNGGHHHTQLGDPHPLGYKEAREHASTLADVHGGTAVLAHGGRPEQAAVAAKEVRASSAR
jgi:hypothetical protein